MSEEKVSTVRCFRIWFSSLSIIKKAALLLAVFMVISAGAAGATMWWYYNRITDLEKMFPELSWSVEGLEEADHPGVDEVFQVGVLNILLMGFDRNAARDEIHSSFRPDTLMVAAINLDTGRVDLLSIPRDTLVSRGSSRGRINESYYYGWSTRHTGITDPEKRHRSGLEAVVQSVSQVLHGVPIHYYVALDMDAVVQIVDIMGGVWYDVERNIYHKDGRLLLPKGEQLLSGSQFLIYVRNRQFVMGDLRRVENQQNILIDAFEQFKQKGKLTWAPEVYLSVRDNVSTNLSVDQIAALAFYAASNIEKDSFHTYTLAGRIAFGRLSEQQTRSRYFYLLDQKYRADIVKAIWGLSVTPAPPDTLYPPLPDEPDWDEDSYHDSYEDEPGDDYDEESSSTE